MKFQKIWDKDSFLKAKREKRHITFKEMGIKLAPDFLSASLDCKNLCNKNALFLKCEILAKN